MNWSHWRRTPWVDTRAAFVARVAHGGRLLDLGTSDGETLTHFAELRPDLRFAAIDLNIPARLPRATEFKAVNLERDALPWDSETFDAITCMHLIEHLRSSQMLWTECQRVLKPGGRLYVETPGPLSLTALRIRGAAEGSVTMNFYDDPTHTELVPVAKMRADSESAGLRFERAGKSRNWLFVLAYPIFSLLRPNTRKRYVAKLHWMGWSHYIIVSKAYGNKNVSIQP